MSVEQGEIGEVGDADVMLAQALAQAVREVGRNLAADPRRVQGMVSDVLGVESRTRRAEIDAVVLAAEESVPEDLLANRITMATALDRLHERGLDEAVAVFAVDVWRYALGMLADDAQPPSLTNSLESSTNPVVTDPAQDSVNELQPEWLAAPVAATAAYTQMPAPPHDPVVAATPEKPANSRRNLLIGAGAAVVLVLGLVFVLASRGDDSDATVDAATTTEVAVSTTAAPTTTAAATTTAVAITEAVFAVETTPTGDVARTYAIDNGVLVGTLAFTNTTGADTTVTHYEVVPKSLAATADLITSEPAATMIKNDPVIAWNLPIVVGQSAQVTFRVDVPDTVTSADLERWKTEQATEAAAFKAEFDAVPVLTLVTPAELHIGTSDAGTGDTDINGSVSPANALVSMAGTPIAVRPDGTWTQHVAGMPPGPNGYVITATNVFGQQPVTTAGTIVVEAPPEETTPPVTPTTKPRTTPGTPTPPVQPPTEPPPDPGTPPPAEPPPDPFAVSISGASTVTANTACRYTYTLRWSGGTPASITWSNGGGSGTTATFGFQPPAGSTSISVTVTSTDGQTDSFVKSILEVDSATCV